MSDERFSRTETLIGSDALEKLNNSKVAIFGIGGVGGHVVEALARSGVGSFLLVDSDTVDITNINRQIVATHSSIGKKKIDVMEERIKDIILSSRKQELLSKLDKGLLQDALDKHNLVIY